MNTQPQIQNADESPDEAAFDALVCQVMERLEAGEAIDPSLAAGGNPGVEQKLEQLLPALEAMVGLGQSKAGFADERCLSQSNDYQSALAQGLLGDFQIVREIGRGGMGVVYEAEQISLSRRVALKVLPFAAMLGEQQLKRFKNEARAAATLKHPNIVSVYSVGCDRGVHYYAMELIEGHSLDRLLNQLKCNQEKRTPARETPIGESAIETAPLAALSTEGDTDSWEYFRNIARLAADAASALHHAHEQGIIHRDIKPANLLLDRSGKVSIADFGLARLESDAGLTMSGDMLGTLRYMSPEQGPAQGVVDHRTDIYSLGATLYELATLRPAYNASDRKKLLHQIASDDPPPPRQTNARIPVDIETIILKAMSKEATSRYTTAADMADDLRRFLEHKPIHARRPYITERASKWARRHVAMISISSAAITVAAISFFVATLLTFRAYTSEAQQRAAAVGNLDVASDVIDRLLSRVSSERYFHGDLAQAEMLADDAVEFYEKLLAHSDDTKLRFRAADAYGKVAQVWLVLQKYERAGTANERAGQLLERLVSEFPDVAQYVAALAANYNRIGLVDWAVDRPLAAEPAFRQSWEISTELAERFPNDPIYQDGVADVLSNLGAICYLTGRVELGNEYYGRANALRKNLPAELNESAEGLASQAGSLTNQAIVAGSRGEYDRAIELLETSIPTHKESLAKWPTNPVALDCYYICLSSIAEFHLAAGHEAEAAAAVERCVREFPDRLQALHQGAVHLLRCGPLSNDQAASQLPYRQRAHELVAQADSCTTRRPDMVSAFAIFLLSCDDKSFRDPPRALELANALVKEVPERDDAWSVLALAHYRNGDWQAADNALQKAIQLSTDGRSTDVHWLLGSMIQWKLGRLDEARQWFAKVRSNSQQEPASDTLAAEAATLIQPSGDN